MDSQFPGREAAAQEAERRNRSDRRASSDRRKVDAGPPPGVPDRRTGADRRSGLDRRDLARSDDA
jgi:hypothetical protein